MERIFALFIRAGLAAIFGFMFGSIFMVGTFWIIPQIMIPPMWALSLSVGFGCGLAAFICFLKPEANRVINLTTFAIALPERNAGRVPRFTFGGSRRYSKCAFGS